MDTYKGRICIDGRPSQSERHNELTVVNFDREKTYELPEKAETEPMEAMMATAENFILINLFDIFED